MNWEYGTLQKIAKYFEDNEHAACLNVYVNEINNLGINGAAQRCFTIMKGSEYEPGTYYEFIDNEYLIIEEEYKKYDGQWNELWTGYMQQYIPLGNIVRIEIITKDE